jgi:fructose-1,6-bisphosphatase/inositol monophosphatase family enzyme
MESAWDIVPFELFVREAGYFATGVEFEPITFNEQYLAIDSEVSLVFSNRDSVFHQRAPDLMNECDEMTK